MLEAYSFTGSHVSLLQKEVDRHVRTLVSEHVSARRDHRCPDISDLWMILQFAYFLKESGLAPVAEAIDSKPEDVRPSDTPYVLRYS